MRNIFSLLITLVFAILFCSCKNVSPNPNAGYYKYDVICINSEMDGSITVKSYGMGKNRKDAVDQAMKNALDAVMFKGIRAGNESECNLAPLIYSEQVKKRMQSISRPFFQIRPKYINLMYLQKKTYVLAGLKMRCSRTLK